jgi:hypothetical protein
LGSFHSLGNSVRENLATFSIAIYRIDCALDRQAEALAAAAATSPIAVALRSQNLTFTNDTVVNVVLLRFGRLRVL